MPIGSGVRRYSPRESVTATTDGTCRAGLVTVTVTPGSTAPLSSVTWPSMPAPSWPAPALAERANSISKRIAAVPLDRSNHRLVILFSPSDTGRDKRAAVMRHTLHHGLFSCVGVYADEHEFQRP